MRFLTIIKSSILSQGFVLLFLFFAVFNHSIFGQNEPCSISKKYAITSAQYANKSYEMAENAYFIKQFKLTNQFIDTSIYYIQEAIAAIDSAIFFAKDSDLVALDHARLSKSYSQNTYSSLIQAIKLSDFEEKTVFV